RRLLQKRTEVGSDFPAVFVHFMAAEAPALGQIFGYPVEPSPADPVDPGRLWALNRFFIAPELNSVPGVAEVATVGGVPVEYQIDVRPEDLRAYGITLGDLYSAVARSNLTVGGRVIQKGNAEYEVRSVAWLGATPDAEGGEGSQTRVIQQLKNTVIREVNGTPTYVKSVATVQLGQQFRRGVFEKDGNEVSGGVVLMRYG